MKSKFHTITLMGRSHTAGVVDTLQALIKFLQQRDIKITIEKETAAMLPKVELEIVNRENLGKECQLIIVVGGDGSLLNAARAAADQNIPVLGVNRGKLGFLTDICPDDIQEIDKILNGEYIEEQRFLLESKVINSNKVVTHDTALNDVVLLPSEINRMIEFTINIDGQLVCSHRADGMIVATPTGSTAHALSGGGPILHPGLDAMVLLPMFPHTLSSRPIVVKGSSNIEIVLAQSCNAAPNISCDGQKLIPIPERGTITIRKHPNNLRLIHLTNYNYYETLRCKLHWENKC